MRNMEKLLMLAVLGICTGVVGAELAASQRGTLSRQLLSAQHTAGQAENLVREANKMRTVDFSRRQYSCRLWCVPRWRRILGPTLRCLSPEKRVLDEANYLRNE